MHVILLMVAVQKHDYITLKDIINTYMELTVLYIFYAPSLVEIISTPICIKSLHSGFYNNRSTIESSTSKYFNSV